jgi:lipoate-protein ligase A
MPGYPVSAQFPGGMDMLADDGAGPGDPQANLALEEALVRAAPVRPVLRIWRSSACVVIGRAQRVAREVNLAACTADGVSVLRRASGGGTVYQDPGNLNISVAVPGRAADLADELAALVAGVLTRLGLTPSIGSRGVFVGPAKVSGLASQVTRDGTLAHATLLVATPAGRILTYLAPAPPDRHPTDSRRCATTALQAVDPALGMATCQHAVLAEAAARYGPLGSRPLRAAERSWQERLLAERYRQDSWHRTGRCEEASWTRRPVLISTG